MKTIKMVLAGLLVAGLSVLVASNAYAVYPNSFEFENELRNTTTSSYDAKEDKIEFWQSQVKFYEAKLDELKSKASLNEQAKSDMQASVSAIEEKTALIKTKLDQIASASGASKQELSKDISTALNEVEAAYKEAVQK